MKKLLLILMLFPLLTMGQMAKEELPDNLYSVDLHLQQKPTYKKMDVNSGYVLIMGGALFTLLGVATPNEGEFVNGKYRQRPIYKQPSHLLAVITGSTLLLTGIVVTIGR